jgi:ribosomal protein S18 acetylase RimI-like enzyme
MDDELANPDLIIRNLTLADLPRLVAIDQKITGRTRSTWYEGKLQRALRDSDVQVSLGAEEDGMLVGAMLGSVQYGEFGQPEPLAVLDTVLVDRGFGGKGIARALFEQLTLNLRALRIERIRTEVAWNDHELLSFFGRMGFAPVPRLVLEASLEDELP